MAKRACTIILGLHGSKDAVYEDLYEAVQDEDLTQEITDKLINDPDLPIQYVNYEVLMYVDIFDDGTYKVSHMESGGIKYVPEQR